MISLLKAAASSAVRARCQGTRRGWAAGVGVGVGVRVGVGVGVGVGVRVRVRVGLEV